MIDLDLDSTVIKWMHVVYGYSRYAVRSALWQQQQWRSERGGRGGPCTRATINRVAITELGHHAWFPPFRCRCAVAVAACHWAVTAVP